MLPLTITSDSAAPTRPPSIRKLFLMTPEKLPLAAGMPIDSRPTMAPRCTPPITLASGVAPAAISQPPAASGTCGRPVLRLP